MASAAIFSSLRRRRSPSLDAFLAPVDLKYVALIETLSSVSSELLSSFRSKTPPFLRRNSRSLLRKIEVLAVLFDHLRGSEGLSLSPTAVLCLKELHLWLYRSKILLDYCYRSGKLWVLLRNHSVSSHFHELGQEISTLLDVFPLNEFQLNYDTIEHLELLRAQSRRSKLHLDKNDELLRLKLYSFLSQLETGDVPGFNELYSFFVEKLKLCDAKSYRDEIEFLEEQIMNDEGDVEPAASVLIGFVSLTRYSRFLLFGFEEEDEVELGMNELRNKKAKKGLISQEIGETFITIPKDFCCPISLDVMRDPVLISTGQTFDRDSISRWTEEGNCTCPKTGQVLSHNSLVPNRALRNLIMKWCVAHGIPYDRPDTMDLGSEGFPAAAPSKAAIEANKAIARLLVQQLANGTHKANAIAAREIRLLAKTGRTNRAYIAEAGAITHLKRLLSSPDSIAQENSVTAMLNLSIYEKNKSRIMDEGCLGLIAGVLRFGHTTEARENAAATLFSLSAVHEYKKRIAEEKGAIEALTGLMKNGTSRGKKDAITALFNLSTHTDNCLRMIESGAVTALVWALGCEVVAEEAAAALALIVRQPFGVEAVGKEEMAVAGLTGMMRCGTPRGKENAVAALLELCRSGGVAVTERVLNAPALASLIQTLLFTGTKRARRKAASLARVFQRCQIASLHFGGLGVGYAFAGNSVADRDSSFASDVSMSVSISVPVL